MALTAVGALLLSLCDGQRTVAEIADALGQRVGGVVPVERVQAMLEELDRQLLLEGERLAEARRAALERLRADGARPMLLAGRTYPREPRGLMRQFREYGWGRNGARAAASAPEVEPLAHVRGVVSPHIDYQRGGPRYAEIWDVATRSARRARRAIILGTGHYNQPGFTLTRQSYQTPLGVVPTDLRVVDALAEALGPERAFAEELTHVGEHSIELVLVWLHLARAGEPLPIVPVLCGSFHEYTSLGRDAATDPAINAVLEVLGPLAREEDTLVVSAADLAHVGPAFGDPPFTLEQRRGLETADRRLLGHVVRADANAFLDDLVREHDARKVCGLPPTYVALRLLRDVRGVITGYEQCPADEQHTSWVSIAGVALGH